MAITITGSAGCNFDLQIVNTATDTGSKTVIQQVETAVRAVTYTNASLVAVLAGQIGTEDSVIDLFSIADVTDATHNLRLQQSVGGIVLGSLLTIVIHNKTTGSDNITVSPGDENSFLPESEQITIEPGSAAQLTYASGKTVSATVRNIKLVGDALAMACEVYILGNA